MGYDTDRLEIFQDKRGGYRWRRIDAHGIIVGASSEAYASRADCEANMTRGANARDRWEFYTDRRRRIRWRRMAVNGLVVGSASRGFVTRAEAEANARRQGFED
jgi:uncharacterized protein YegP (UPF0339 family)